MESIIKTLFAPTKDNWVLFIAQGIGVTLSYSLVAALFGVLLGSILACILISKNRVGCALVKLYLSVIRGTPLLLQLSIVYYAFPIKVTAFVAGGIAFSLNSAAYICEIIRAGINSIDKGQFEAAKALSIPKYLIMKDIIFPQALRNIAPALVNELINLIKESAVISIIGEADLMRRASLVAAQQYTYFTPLLVAGCCYYILILLFTLCARKLERKLQCY